MRAVIFLAAFLAAAVVRGMDIREAMLDKDLEIKIHGLDGHELAYSDKELWIGVMNQKDHPVTITGLPGFIVVSEEGDVQDMIITEAFEFVASNEVYTETGLHAMCIQSSNKTPNRFNDFQPSHYAQGAMRTLAEFIYKQGETYQNFMGQEAMWVLSDQHSIYDISGTREDILPLANLLGELTNVRIETDKLAEEVEFIDRAHQEYALYLKFYLQHQDDIKLQLFNHKGEYMRDLLIRNNQGRGQYNMKYRVSLLGLLDEKFYVRLYVGDEMRTEFTLIIKDS